MRIDAPAASDLLFRERGTVGPGRTNAGRDREAFSGLRPGSSIPNAQRQEGPTRPRIAEVSFARRRRQGRTLFRQGRHGRAGRDQRLPRIHRAPVRKIAALGSPDRGDIRGGRFRRPRSAAVLLVSRGRVRSIAGNRLDLGILIDGIEGSPRSRQPRFSPLRGRPPGQIYRLERLQRAGLGQ